MRQHQERKAECKKQVLDRIWMGAILYSATQQLSNSATQQLL